MIRLLLADDHILVAEGLAALLRNRFDLLEVVHDGRSLVSAARTHRPDVIIADLTMPLLNGLDAAEQILAQDPHMKIILLTMHGEPEIATRAFRMGLRGYAVKAAPAEQLLEAVEMVAAGHQYLSPGVAAEVADQLAAPPSRQPSGPSPLTIRQREVLQLIAEGHTMKKIAAELTISPRTAESHKYEIMRVLGASTTAELVRHAVRLQLVEPLGLQVRL